jgi:threonine dehydrogenase-like Zn-dependent dehydrogenase
MVPGVAVRPPAPRSLHLINLPLPALGPDDVLVRVKEVGYCGTDREIIEGHFGSAPDGFESLVIGHETLGMVEAIGANVSSLQAGDLVTATARRPCDCRQCLGGEPDFCSKFGYRERGIIGLHGYLTERFVEREEHLVRVPDTIAHLGVLTEPTSVAEKAWRVAQAVQSRLTTWRPESAFVIGAGPIGVLTTLVLRANGLAVATLDLKPVPNSAEAVVAKAGANYLCTQDVTTGDLKAALPRPDVIVECTGSSAAVFMAMELLANNGVLVSLSVTGGNRELTVPADKLNLEFVLGNKVWVGSVNSSLTDFASAVRDLQRFEETWPGLTNSMITRRLSGLASALDLPEAGFGSLKTVIEV